MLRGRQLRRGGAARLGHRPEGRMLAALVLTGCLATTTPAAPAARAAVGELGPPPTQPEIERTLTDLYQRNKPLGSDVDVVFDGPINVGQVVQHDLPGDPLCLTCAGFAKVSSPTYPVFALVRVSVKYGLASSSVYAGDEPTYTTTFTGANCLAQRDCAYHFYRDELGYWLVV